MAGVEPDGPLFVVEHLRALPHCRTRFAPTAKVSLKREEEKNSHHLVKGGAKAIRDQTKLARVMPGSVFPSSC